MQSKKYLSQNKKTLRNKINKYIFKKKDICCEDDIDRNLAIQDIFTLYSKIAGFMYEKDEYLSYIDNDIVKFINYKINLNKENDKEGISLWKEISSKITLYKTPNKKKIIELLNTVPLYYLLSFLGFAYYRYKRNIDIIEYKK
jgi:superfamily I DNA and RNA helicase